MGRSKYTQHKQTNKITAGGCWNRKEKLWQLPYGEVLALGLENRIVNKGEKSVQ